MLIDLSLSIVSLYFFIRGLSRGGVLELYSLAGLSVSTLLTKKYADIAYKIVVKFLKLDNSSLNIGSNYYIYLFSYALAFAFFYFSVYSATLILKKFLKLSMLNWIDSSLGAVFGLVKGTLVSTLLFSFLSFLGTYDKRIITQVKNSYSNKIIPKIAKQIYFMIPTPIKRKIEHLMKDESVQNFIDNLTKDNKD